MHFVPKVPKVFYFLLFLLFWYCFTTCFYFALPRRSISCVSGLAKARSATTLDNGVWGLRRRGAKAIAFHVQKVTELLLDSFLFGADKGSAEMIVPVLRNADTKKVCQSQSSFLHWSIREHSSVKRKKKEGERKHTRRGSPYRTPCYASMSSQSNVSQHNENSIALKVTIVFFSPNNGFR